MAGHLLVLGDSLTYHGPGRPEFPADARLWPNITARLLPGTPEVDLHARLGWTARDGWWAVTRDPTCWGRDVPRASGIVVALGGMDQLPAAIPTYLREGISYLPRSSWRRVARRAYGGAAPALMRITGGRMRQLPQRATDAYLGRIVSGVRFYRPHVPIVVLSPSPFRSAYYPVASGHEAAVAAGRRWAARAGVEWVDVDPLIRPSLDDGSANPDGMHWSWRAHEEVGRAVAEALVRAGFTEATPWVGADGALPAEGSRP